MLGFRPAAVILPTDDLHTYVISHETGCNLRGFEHVFHTGSVTVDETQTLDISQTLGILSNPAGSQAQGILSVVPSTSGGAQEQRSMHNQETTEGAAAEVEDHAHSGHQRLAVAGVSVDDDTAAIEGADCGNTHDLAVVDTPADAEGVAGGNTDNIVGDSPTCGAAPASVDANEETAVAVCEFTSAHVEAPQGSASFTQESPAAQLFRTLENAEGVIPETQFSEDVPQSPAGRAESPYDFLYENLEPAALPTAEQERREETTDVDQEIVPETEPHDEGFLHRAPQALEFDGSGIDHMEVQESGPLVRCNVLVNPSTPPAAQAPVVEESPVCVLVVPGPAGNITEPRDEDIQITRVGQEERRSIKVDPDAGEQTSHSVPPPNEHDPICVSTDSEEEFREESRKAIPSDYETEISDSAAEEGPSEEGASERKVDPLRCQLKKIGKRKLSVNKKNVRKARELLTENLKLKKKVETLTKQRDEADVTLRTAGLDSTVSGSTFTATPSTLTTSMASAPAASVSEAVGRLETEAVARLGGEDCIPGTQVRPL